MIRLTIFPGFATTFQDKLNHYQQTAVKMWYAFKMCLRGDSTQNC